MDGSKMAALFGSIIKRASSAPPPPAVSASQLVSTLVPVMLVAAIWLAVFLFMRPRYAWNYSPRSTSKILRANELAAPLPGGLFGWFSAFFAVPDTAVLQHQSLDAFFFLRLLKMSVVTCLVGCVITWPILVPIYATGGAGKTELDAITFGNIGSGKQAWRLYAPVVCAWLLFGFIMLMITRESIFYINLRQAYLMNPAYAAKLTSRTVLYVSVPDEYLDEVRLREMLGPHAIRFWFPANAKELDKMVEERDKAAALLEGAETKLIRDANAERMKQMAAGGAEAEPDVETGADSATADRWLTRKQRPTHRLKPIIGTKVDSIEWSREEIARLTPLIETEQAKHRAGDAKRYPAVFVEFDSLIEAQSAYQSLTHHQPLRMAPRYTGIHPLEVIWGNLKISGWERFIRQTLTISAVVITVIYWSVPVAFVGTISNINYWIGPGGKTPFLDFLNKVPKVIFGVITGLLPTILLAVLMSLLPPYLRLLAKLGGAPTQADVEYTVSNYYFSFQVVQVFLVMTLSSAISGSVITIIDKPSQAISILANSIPTANNFYLSYMILQGLGVVSGLLASISGLIVKPLLAKFLGSTPRKLFLRWNSLSTLNYGTVYPIYTNLLVIAISYSVIAPLVTLFSAIGLYFFYFAYRYNIMYVYSTGVDTKGLLYPRALQQLFVGLYIAEVCLIGLVAVSFGKNHNAAIGPLILLIILLVVTVLYNVALNAAIDPLLKYLPKSVAAEERRAVAEGDTAGAPALAVADPAATGPDAKPAMDDAEPANGAAAVQATQLGPPSMLTKFLKPHIYADYGHLRRLMPAAVADDRGEATGEATGAENEESSITRDAYLGPGVWAEPLRLVVPRDAGGVSGTEVRESGKVVPITDGGATLGEKGEILVDEDAMGELYWREKAQRMREGA